MFNKLPCVFYALAFNIYTHTQISFHFGVRCVRVFSSHHMTLLWLGFYLVTLTKHFTTNDYKRHVLPINECLRLTCANEIRILWRLSVNKLRPSFCSPSFYITCAVHIIDFESATFISLEARIFAQKHVFRNKVTILTFCKINNRLDFKCHALYVSLSHICTLL